ncbi:MAG: virulence factor SrfB [Bernardetiaceae bacterium]|nr:virulence factor SrfB [Bernardetiaceae bacterium]
MSVSLIANSGIQFHKFQIEIDPNDDIMKTQGFHEFLDTEHNKISLEYAYYLPDDDMWIDKQILKAEQCLDKNDNLLLEAVNYNLIKSFALEEDEDYFTVSDISDCLDYFASNDEKTVWLPAPYFLKNENNKSLFGPVGWARMMLKEIPEKKSRTRRFDVILAFDTRVDDDVSPDDILFAPTSVHTQDGNNVFALSNNEDYNLHFCNSAYACDWVRDYLQRIIHPNGEPSDFPILKYVGYFLYFVKYLEKLKAFPEIILNSDEQIPVEVDLVIDIGNSNTCGLLFESPHKSDQSFEFKSVKKLKLHDLSSPDRSYDDPFSMRLAFVEANFGDMHLMDLVPEKRPFRWPSLLRLGREAAKLVSVHNLDKDRGKETASHHSSPKRYLWDNKEARIPWQFINIGDSFQKGNIYSEGVSEYFTPSGEYTPEGTSSAEPYYSRKSLMTFVYIEILLHAVSQINSHEFRVKHGESEKPRKLKRITITCPTSIIQHEQVVLRECAAEAVRVLNNFFPNSVLGNYDPDNKEKHDLEVIPSPKDLAKKLSVIDTRKDWIYDEATCAQLVFLYAEISQRYLNRAKIFFDLYGKHRDDVTTPEEKSLTIGSLDIGGGTTDLMICSYQYAGGQGQSVLTPHPLYWESFNLAGDDLMKEIVQQIILQGSANEDKSNLPIGIIENSAREAGVEDLNKKMLNFFGSDSNKQGHMHRMYRKNFIVQVAIPIAMRYLQHAMNNKPDIEVGFDEIFTENQPNKGLIAYFNQHFAPLKFEDIVWKLSKERVFSIVETTFDPILKQLSAILSAYGCDFVLLAGRPTTIPKIREMFIKYYPVSPERIISLNNYRVGRWYPFADDLGYFEDPKTIVSVGALIALMGGNIDKLAGFRLNTKLLKRRLISTCDYIGLLDKFTQNITTHYLTPDVRSQHVDVHSLPMTIGYKQLPNRKYRGRPIYKLDFNEDELRTKVIERNAALEDEKEIHNAVEAYRNNLKNRMPFRITIKRDWSESREHVYIDNIRDAERNDISRRFLNLAFMTLAEEKGYWLDTGEFVLNIK